MAGTGKRTTLLESLKAVAEARGVPFSIQMRSCEAAAATGDIAAAGSTEEGAGPGEDAGGFMYEYSLVHMGFDISRMSMKDKHILAPVLANLGQGSQVLAGEQGRGHRLLVLYHAHLLSSESVLLLQACLEQNEGDLSIWMTSEMPVPVRIRDWFVEIAVAGSDMAFEALGPAIKNWPDIFRQILDKWKKEPVPKLSDVKDVKVYVYEMLMRNLRWVEATHFLLDVVLTHEGLTEEERGKALSILAAAEATAAGITIPSYRIPILWESLLLQLRGIFWKPTVSGPQSDGTARPKRVGRARKTGVGAATSTVA